MKILIVDDNAEDRSILRYYLHQLGREIFEAGDGAEGFETARRERPDLIISDALMPNVDGFEFLREVRRSADLCNIPFIFYSAVYTGCKDEELARLLGADAFMVKPLEAEEFLRQLKILIGGLDSTKGRAADKLLSEDETYLRKYSQMVAARLEMKVQELALANKKLTTSEGRYRNLLASMRDLFLIADTNRTILEVNQPTLRELFGYETEEIVGKSTDLLYGSSEIYQQVGKALSAQKDPRQGTLLEVEFRRKNGELFPGELFALKLLDESGVPIGNIDLIRDVSERHSMEMQLRQAQKLESVGTLAGGIAHDFNNILTVINGYGTMAIMKMTPDDPHRLYIQNMLEASDRAAQLTQDLLLFSRKQVANKKPVELNTVVAQVEKFLDRVIGEDIICQIILPEAPISILADTHQLEQVLMNLAANARDAMPQGGTLTVTTETTVMDSEFVTAHGFGKPGPYALITVSDTGMGMDEATRLRIFEPFFTTKEVGKGTGLGLAVTYGIIKQHDGYINVYSEPGTGTTFRIYLPLIPAEAGEERRAEPEVTSVGGMETILLAEDDKYVRDVTGSVLTESGYTVIEAVDGADAVQKFTEYNETIDLLLFDLIMPKMNGKEALDEIRKIRPGIKFLFSSGYTPDTIRQKVEGANGIHLIAKPALPTELLRKVRSVLDEVT